MTDTFEDFLNSRIDEIEAPTLLPKGTYHVMVQGLYAKGKTPAKETMFIQFTYRFISAQANVDATTLHKSLGNAALTTQTIQDTYYITPKTKWRLKQALRHMGIDVDAHKSLGEVLAETPNRELLIDLVHEARDRTDPESPVFLRVGNTRALH